MFYTYMWLRQKDATPYYIGKGQNKRAYRNVGHNVAKPKSDHLIVTQHWGSEEKAFEMEKWWVSFYGRKDNGTGVLRNLTDGGENPPRMLGNAHAKGKKHSAEANAKKSALGKLRKQSLATREKLSILKKGKSNGLEGRPKPLEQRRKISEAHKLLPKKLSTEQIAEAKNIYAQRGVSYAALAGLFSVSVGTMWRAVNDIPRRSRINP